MRIFCIESRWEEGSKQSVEPILQIIKDNYDVDYKLHHYDTFQEFEEICNLIEKDDDIIYIAAHGDKGVIKRLGENSEQLPLARLAEILKPFSSGKSIHLASCNTLDVSQDISDKFIQDTECRLLTGYFKEVNWVESSAMDILLLDSLVSNQLDTEEDGYNFVTRYSSLINSVGFAIAMLVRRKNDNRLDLANTDVSQSGT